MRTLTRPARMLLTRAACVVLALSACNCARAPIAALGNARPLPVTLSTPPRSDSVVVLIYGDNRPGLRLMTTPWGLPAVKEMRSGDPKQILWGIANIPVFLVQAIVPRLDLFQDLASGLWTHRYSGGNQRRVVEALVQSLPADLVVNTGDLVENGRHGRQWEDFVRLHEPLASKARFVAIPGNHERMWSNEGRANWDAVMGPPARPGRYWYALDLPDSVARFVFLDSDLLADPHDHFPDSLQAALTREQLDWADSALAVPSRWKILVLHHPLVSSGHYLSDWAGADANRPELQARTRLLEMCRRHRVTAVFAGHEHLYQPTYVRGRDGRGFWHITTGGGGSPLYRPSSKEREIARAITLPDGSRTTWTRERSVYHYARLVMTRRPNPRDDVAVLQVQRVRSSGQVSPIEQIDLSSHPVPERE